MSEKPAALDNVLARPQKTAVDLDSVNSTDLKQLARFWFGTTAANKMRKDEAINALTAVFRDRARVEEGLRSLPDDERQILGVVKYYGGALAGAVVESEVRVRGLREKPTRESRAYDEWKLDPVRRLAAKLLLVQAGGSVYQSYKYSGYQTHYPDLVMHPAAVSLVAPVAPLTWKAPSPAPTPTTTVRRSPAQVALDLCAIAHALAQMGDWKTNRGGTLAKSAQNRLQKLLPGAEVDPLTPPAVESLYYEILRGVGAIEADGDGGTVDLEMVKLHLQRPAAEQSRDIVRAWIDAQLWQDGIGVVPDRDSHAESVRLNVGELYKARQLLAWALGRVAHAPSAWLDLETFLTDWASESTALDVHFFWHKFHWNPSFTSATANEELQDKARQLARWLTTVGKWAANALLGAFAHLGLIERGASASGARERWCFRLTEVGRAVFGAPEIAVPDQLFEPRFFTVQPNHELTVYLDAADAGAIWPLAQMARRVSATSGVVQTFALTRDSAYHGLESGLNLDAMRRFLAEHSKTGLPDNVARSLEEWGRRRESLVLRSSVSLGVAPGGAANPFLNLPNSQPVGSFVLLPEAPPPSSQWTVIDHLHEPPRTWHVAADGKVTVTDQADAVALARLSQFADPSAQAWQITSTSVARARANGISDEHVLVWLDQHVIGTLPAILETAIRNWSSPTTVFLGPLLMLQVTRPQACAALLESTRFQPLMVAHVPPDWFIVHPDKRAELEQLLADLGFSMRSAHAGAEHDSTSRAASQRKKNK